MVRGPAKPGGEQVDSKARRNERLLIGPPYDSDEISDGFRRLRRRQVTRQNVTAYARPVGTPIAERRAAFEHAVGCLRQERRDGEAQDGGNAQAKRWINRTAHGVSRKNWRNPLKEQSRGPSSSAVAIPCGRRV
jgi:hypothetical protein